MKKRRLAAELCPVATSCSLPLDRVTVVAVAIVVAAAAAVVAVVVVVVVVVAWIPFPQPYYESNADCCRQKK